METLGTKLFLDTPVWAIAQSSASAEIRAGDGENEAVFKAKRVVIAVSPKLITEIEFTPPLPELRKQVRFLIIFFICFFYFFFLYVFINCFYYPFFHFFHFFNSFLLILILIYLYLYYLSFSPSYSHSNR